MDRGLWQISAEITQIDARIRERWNQWGTAPATDMDQVLDQVGEMGRIDERNADDREAVHQLALALVAALAEARPVIKEALGDAYAYRTDSGEADVDDLEDYEQEACARYMGLAGQLDVTID